MFQAQARTGTHMHINVRNAEKKTEKKSNEVYFHGHYEAATR